MNAHEHHTLTLGLAMLQSAWSVFSNEIGRIAEDDPELAAAWAKVDDALASLDGALRRRTMAAKVKS